MKRRVIYVSPKHSIIDRTRKALNNTQRTDTDISESCGLSTKWLSNFRNMYRKDPSARFIEVLYHDLTGEWFA